MTCSRNAVGDRQFVTVLNVIRADGLEAASVARELALEAGTHRR